MWLKAELPTLSGQNDSVKNTNTLVDGKVNRKNNKKLKTSSLNGQSQKNIGLNLEEKEKTMSSSGKATSHPKEVDTEYPIWDKQAALARVMNKDIILEKLINSFLDEMPERIETLKSLSDLSDLETVTRLAHTIKGVSGNMSGIRLHKLAEQVEKHGKSGDKTSINQLLPELFSAYDDLKDCFESYQSVDI
jgi:HPt (histidine-containing phosphotransfer) domain-containing protein